jgi:hypothetical protein
MADTVETKKLSREQVQKKIASDYEKDHEMYTGRFRYLERPGSTLSFRFKKYKQDGFPEYHLTDGQTYTLPRMIVEHLNNKVHYKKYQELRGSNDGEKVYAAMNDGRIKTNQTMHVVAKDPRCEFIPLEFVTGDKMNMLPNKIVEVVGSN